MPVYQYRERGTGRIVELVRPVAYRDKDVPAELERIEVPVALAIGGTSSSPVDPRTAVGSVPKALKSLSNNEVNGMVKESGFSVDKYKRVWDM